MKKNIDISQISHEKGSYITPETIARITETPIEDEFFQLSALAVKEKIYLDEKGKGVVLVIKNEGKGLRILTDAEALEYLNNSWDNRINGLNFDEYRMRGIDSHNLTFNQAAKREQDLIRMATINQAIKYEVEKLNSLEKAKKAS